MTPLQIMMQTIINYEKRNLIANDIAFILIAELHLMLEAEKQSIVKAYNEGVNYAENKFEKLVTGEDYYKKNYDK